MDIAADYALWGARFTDPVKKFGDYDLSEKISGAGWMLLTENEKENMRNGISNTNH
jgi:hypothetical protein